MPVEIISGTTNPGWGVIDKQDLINMKDDFINEADLKPYNGRLILRKKFSVSVLKDELKDLIAFYENSEKGINVIKLNFAIQLNPFVACNNQSNNADSLTVVLEAASFIDQEDTELGHVSHVSIGDYVVIPGYDNVNKNGWSGGPCCPSSNP